MCMHFLNIPYHKCVYVHKECNLIAIIKKLCSSSHSEIQLKVFTGEAAEP